MAIDDHEQDCGAARPHSQLELAYASFRDVASSIRSCAAREPAWERYAADVLAQLHREGVLGYDGAPMLDEAGPLTLRGAVEAFNLAVRQARLLAQAVVADEEYRSLGLPVQVDLLRGGNTGRVSMSGASWFEQRSLLVVNHAPAAPEGGAAFVLFGVDLTPPQGRASELVAGAVRLSRPPVETWYHLYRRTTPITPGTALLAESAKNCQRQQSRPTSQSGVWPHVHGCQE